jgi:hypothetical protein
MYNPKSLKLGSFCTAGLIDDGSLQTSRAPSQQNVWEDYWHRKSTEQANGD